MVDLIRYEKLDELREFSKAASESQLFGLTVPQAMMVVAAGQDLGFSAAQSLRAFHLIDGRPRLSADAMVAAALRSPVCEYFRCVEATDTQATWITKRKGNPERSCTYTAEDAAKAGRGADSKYDNWKKYPARMLSARAKSFLARDEYPDILLGLIAAEEIIESTAPTTVAPTIVERVMLPAKVEQIQADVKTDTPPDVESYRARIQSAASSAELLALSAEISRLDDATRAALRSAYIEKSKVLG